MGSDDDTRDGVETDPPVSAPPGRSRRSVVLIVAPLVAVALVAAALLIFAEPPAGSPAARPTTITASPRVKVTPTPKPKPTSAPAPALASQAALARVPLAFYDAAIAALPDPATLHPKTTWQIARPVRPLTALYATPATSAVPIAALSKTVTTVDTPTAVAVYGRQGDMVLVSTPSRRTVPGATTPSAPSATFAWARAADLRFTAIDRVVEVSNATSEIAIVTRAGVTTVTEKAVLGTPGDPTPAKTSSYIEADYVDTRIAYTEGNPIALTGAHSSLLPGYGGNSALTALHFYPGEGGNSHGCVRISAAMTKSLATLPVGTPVLFY